MKKPSLLILIALLTSISLLSACAPATTPTATPETIPAIETPQLIVPRVSDQPTETPSALVKYQIPVYYPETYAATVEASKKEDGLMIYSIMAAENWKPIIETFNTHYPWIKVTTLDLGASEVFTRYYDESEKKLRTADIVISSDPVSWFDFFNKKEILPYRSQEDQFIPDWSKTSYGTYTVSSDPMVIIYNKKLVSAPPKSMTELVALVKSDPAAFKKQVVTYDAELNATGFAINWFWIDRMGADGWSNLDILGQTRPLLMTSGASMVDAVGKGDAKLGYFVSAITVFPRLETYPDLGWSYMMDGQPILLRNMAITKGAASPNSAQLMIDFILSQEGQYALAIGGLTPYRSDISGITENHFDNISTTVGDNNLILFSLDARLRIEKTRTDFIDRWKTAMQKVDAPAPTAVP